MAAPSLEEILQRLDRLRERDERLERYRFEPSENRVERFRLVGPPSDEVALLLGHGGWWPGALLPDPTDSGAMDVVLDPFERAYPHPVDWVDPGILDDRMYAMVPVGASATSPVLLFHSSALVVCAVFPTIASLLESFCLVIEELGFSHHDARPAYGWSVDLGFPEWLADWQFGWGAAQWPVPGDAVDDEAMARLRARMLRAAEQWSTTHPLWSPHRMPFCCASDRVPLAAAATLLGVEPERLRP